uniref:ORF3 n=1 Tax=Torque teno Leptonychotes weddellii virus-1 TaxID=2012676 RepID=A0A1Z2RVQ0_9VIRU|nr:ORF3 [Torque teno Leptonychotes weddellii virus 1]
MTGLAEKYRLVPYSKKDLLQPQTSCQETSTQTGSSQKELIKELLDLIEITSQPDWGMSPITGSPPSSELSSESLLESETESEPESLSSYCWEDEENPGGEGPPLGPPAGENPLPPV